ncbi:MAG: hypothetical protein R2848_17000 [Thermomicrobiales bacterium]
MTPDFVTLMAASKVTRSHAHSALPDAPVIADFITKPGREPRILTLRKQLAGMIWPGELVVPTSEQTVPASGC